MHYTLLKHVQEYQFQLLFEYLVFYHIQLLFSLLLEYIFHIWNMMIPIIWIWILFRLAKLHDQLYANVIHSIYYNSNYQLFYIIMELVRNDDLYQLIINDKEKQVNLKLNMELMLLNILFHHNHIR